MHRVLGGSILALLVAGAPAAAPAAGTANAAAAEVAPACLLVRGTDRRTTRSSECTACHDGLRGSFGGRRGAHPVEIRYRPGGSGANRMRPNPESRPGNVVLPGGRITCLTCHDSKSNLPWHLAARADGKPGNRLCDACHAAVMF